MKALVKLCLHQLTMMCEKARKIIGMITSLMYTKTHPLININPVHRHAGMARCYPTADGF